ncbi:MAG: hypothetical protein JRN23_04335 [Nitrososphaerota archaeon]|nr:hypothetical protein [Nitrososphaerota archaeon]
MKIRKRSLTTFELVLVAALLAAPSAVFATTVVPPSSYVAYKPYGYVWGTATNTVLTGQTPLSYNPSAGVEATLPYNYSKGTLTFPYANVDFKGNLLNSSVKGTSTVTPASVLSLSSIQTLTANGVQYMSITATNASDLVASTAYTAALTDLLDPTVTVPATSNLVFTGEITAPSASFASYAPFVVLGVVDTGGSLHNVELTFAKTYSDVNTAAATSQTPASALTMSYATGATTGTAAATTYTVQATLPHMLTTLGYTWTPSVIKYVSYGLKATTAATLVKVNSISAEIFDTFQSASAVDVNAGTNALFNGTGTTESYSTAVTADTAISPITVSGQPWTQIAGVSFPFIFAPTPIETLYPDQLQVEYSFNFSAFPSTIAGMSWSGVDMNMSMNSLTPNMFSTLFINGGSYLTTITNWTGTTTGTLLSSLSAGTSYYVQTLVTYTSATYNDVTAAPSLYSNPTAWFEQYFWEIIIAIAGALGLGTAAYASKARELRVPK